MKIFYLILMLISIILLESNGKPALLKHPHTWGNLYILTSHKYPTDPNIAVINNVEFTRLHGKYGEDLVRSYGDGSRHSAGYNQGYQNEQLSEYSKNVYQYDKPDFKIQTYWDTPTYA